MSLAAHNVSPNQPQENPPSASYTYEASPRLAAFSLSRFPSPANRSRGQGFSQPHRPFCKACYEADKGRSIYLSHASTDARCPSKIQFSAIDPSYPTEVTECGDDISPGTETTNDQVCSPINKNHSSIPAGLAHIQPVAAQILSLTHSIEGLI